jgi:hypothetical protein
MTVDSTVQLLHVVRVLPRRIPVLVLVAVLFSERSARVSA